MWLSSALPIAIIRPQIIERLVFPKAQQYTPIYTKTESFFSQTRYFLIIDLRPDQSTMFHKCKSHDQGLLGIIPPPTRGSFALEDRSTSSVADVSAVSLGVGAAHRLSVFIKDSKVLTHLNLAGAVGQSRPILMFYV